ncbi:MAG TPA: hypothetical protein DEG43_14190 [Acidimicrobiaceae bacterium]|nr:hypothetical protein [Acidimicrobiaceae bacterium]
MAAPEYVPVRAGTVRHSYNSPPHREGSWLADRPGELGGLQPEGDRLGSPGPDQGFALKIASRFRGRLALSAGEHEADALAGAVAVALKRASLFGRAPVVHDLQAAFAVWGLLNADAPAELVAKRTEMFEEVHHPHHYEALRAVADAVPAEVLRRPIADIQAGAKSDWRAQLAF